MRSSHKFWWNQLNPHVYTNYYLTRNEVVTVELILFHKTNKSQNLCQRKVKTVHTKQVLHSMAVWIKHKMQKTDAYIDKIHRGIV
jgi:phage terminase large subunit GpA-like protein